MFKSKRLCPDSANVANASGMWDKIIGRRFALPVRGGKVNKILHFVTAAVLGVGPFVQSAYCASKVGDVVGVSDEWRVAQADSQKHVEKSFIRNTHPARAESNVALRFSGEEKQ